MKTPEKIKKGLECCANGNACIGHCPYYGRRNMVECTSQLARDALTLIRQLESKLAEYERPLEPLTFEEAILDDSFLERKDDSYVEMALNDFAVNMPEEGFMLLTVHGEDDLKLDRDGYNKTWRCWSRRPTDEERKAAAWQTT